MILEGWILKSNEQMVERVARAKLDAINYILNPANKKSVVQTMAKNQGSESGENRSLLGHVDELPRKICPTVPGVRSVLKLMVELGINPKASQIKNEDVVKLALCKRLGGDGGS